MDGKETAWKLECFPNGKQKVGEVSAASVILHASVDPWHFGTDPDPALFVSDFQDANKN